MKPYIHYLFVPIFTLFLFSCDSENNSPTPPSQPVDNTPNLVPEVSAGENFSIEEQIQTTLSGTAMDSDGSITETLWIQISGETVELINPDSLSATFTAPVTVDTIELEFELTATDNEGAISTDSVTVTVLPVNLSPDVSTGEDFSIEEQVQTSLTGTAIDSDGSIIETLWRQTSGKTVELINPDSLSAVFTAPVTVDTIELEFELTATDNEGAISTDSVTVTVLPVNLPPEVSAGEDSTVNEQTTVPLTGTVIDQDGTITAINWIQTDGDFVELTNAGSTVASFNAPTTLVPLELTFDLSATDNEGASSIDTVVITILPVNLPPIINVDVPNSILTGSDIIIGGSATDTDGEIVAIAWQQLTGTPLELSNTDELGLNIQVPFDYPDDGVQFLLSVTDNEGAISTQTFDVTIDNSEAFVEFTGNEDPAPLDDVELTITAEDELSMTPATLAEHGYTTHVVDNNTQFNFDVAESSLTLIGELDNPIMVGDIIVGTTADGDTGFMRRVLEVIDTLYVTEKASISEAFPDASIEMTLALSNTSSVAEVQIIEQGEVLQSERRLELLSFERRLQRSFGDGAKVVMDLSINSEFKIDFKLDILDSEATRLSSIVETNLSTASYLDVDYENGVNFPYSYSFKPVVDKTRIFLVSGIPLLINVQVIPVYSANLALESSGKLKMGYKVSGQARGGFEYQDSIFSEVASFVPSFSRIGPDVELGGVATLTNSLKLLTVVSLYEVSFPISQKSRLTVDGPGVGIDFGPYAVYTASATANPVNEPPIDCLQDLSVGLSSDLSIDLGGLGSLLLVDNPEDINLFDSSKSLWSSPECPFEPELSTIAGIVSDDSSMPLDGVSISLEGNSEALNRSVTTSSDGSYALENLLPGEYNARYSKSGYRSEIMKVITIGTQTTNVPMVLTAIDEDDPDNEVEDDQGNPLSQATAMGDPHIRTFDGLSYGFHGLGEYTLAKSDSGDLEIQTRTGQLGDSRSVSLNQAIAANVNGDRVAFYRGETGIAVLIDGELTDISGTLQLPQGGILRKNGERYSLIWSDQSKIELSRRGNFIDLKVQLNNSRRETVSGVLGYFDGQNQGELRTRDGEIIGNSADFTQLYDVFGESWRVTAEDTLFDYFGDETLTTFVDRNFPGVLLTVERIREQIGEVEYQRILELCSRYVTLQSRLDACIIDVAISGEEIGLEAYLEIAREQEVIDIVAPPVIEFISPTEGAILNSNITFSGTVEAESPIVLLEYQINDGERTDVTNQLNNNQFAFSLSSVLFNEGQNQFTLFATDADEVTGNKIVNFTFDSDVAPEAGADLVVLNDVNVFDNERVLQADNSQFVRNIVNYTTPGPRGNGNIVYIDYGHGARCNNCVTISITEGLFNEEGFTVDYLGEEDNLVNIPEAVKVILLWTPTVQYTTEEINSLKRFARDGGRIVFVGENQGFYGQTGLDIENQFLSDMGAEMRNIGETVYGGRVFLETSSDNTHQLVTDVDIIRVDLVSLIELGPNDFPILTSPDGSDIIIGVAKIDVTLNQERQSKLSYPNRKAESPIRYKHPAQIREK